MGAVWQAHDELLGRTVAVKQLMLQPGLNEAEQREARQRAMREGRIAARLHHPNAITVFDVVTDDYGQPCLIMEYLESTSLAAVLQARKTLPPMEVARIGAQVASALAAAHQVGVVHRDIKPANILLDRNGTAKITDFGISRAVDDVTVTKTGMIAGTPAYLAPEVAIGQPPGPESDIFSLGSTLYAATEGQPPFGLSENTLSLLHAVAAGQINPPRRSGPLTSVLAVLLHPEKERRPNAAEAERLLAAVARGETPLGGPVDDGPTAMVAGAGSGDLRDEFDDAHTRPIERAEPTTALRTADEPEPEPHEDDDTRPRGWLKPAAAAALLIGGITALALYFSGGTDEAPPVGSHTNSSTDSSARQVKQDTSPSKEDVKPPPTTSTTTSTSKRSEEPEPPPPGFTTEVPEPEDEPTAEPEEPPEGPPSTDDGGSGDDDQEPPIQPSDPPPSTPSSPPSSGASGEA